METDRYFHLSARAYRTPVALTDHEVASWLWPALREAFPEALTTLLMPNHPHLITPGRDAESVRRRLSHVLGGLRRSKNPGAALRWEPIEPPIVIEAADKLARQVRYVTLNPCRARLAADPLSWPWSTHRDVVGAIADPWVTADRVAAALGRSPRDAARWLHGYVSGDPSVAIEGTEFPVAATGTSVARVPLEWIMEAAAAATRGCAADLRRRTPTRHVFLALAARSGWSDLAQLARVCGITSQAVRAHLGPSVALEAAALCLGDSRLRIAHVEVIPHETFRNAKLRAG